MMKCPSNSKINRYKNRSSTNYLPQIPIKTSRKKSTP